MVVYGTYIYVYPWCVGGEGVYVLYVCVHGLASFWVCIHGSSQWSVVSVNVDSDRQRIIL